MASCSNSEPDPSAAQKYDELILQVVDAKSGKEFESIASSLAHGCRRYSCSSFCLDELETKPDEILVCGWDESTPTFPDVAVGAVHSVLYLKDDSIIKSDIEVVYIGP